MDKMRVQVRIFVKSTLALNIMSLLLKEQMLISREI
jgi:hypothetical protein